MIDSQITVTLPDGTQRNFPNGATPMDVAQSIGAGLARAALAARVQGELWDLNRPLGDDCDIALITKDQEEGLEIIRHDAAHVMAEAVKELYPETQVTIGPSIQDGFYYDFHRETSFTPEDLITIEGRMREIVGRDEKIVREVWNREKAIKFFRDQGEKFKAEIIEDLPGTEEITLYRQGDFIDLCRGPHLPSTARLGTSFKLMKLAGAYWRGDSKNPMLQRIYGTAWATDKDLRSYLRRLEEAEKRDHRKLGREMGLFHQQEEAVGNVFWHDKGWTLYRIVENYIRSRLEAENYQEVKTPQMLDRSLWEASGHWDKFREAMFTVESSEGKTLAIKPMNCPCHVQIFRQGMKSYRDLPLRMAEFGSCHRNEPSGALHGLFRGRAFVQDDAHIFCTEDQIVSETKEFCRLLISVYEDFGFSKDQITIKFSDRPEVRAGDDSVWDKAEAALSEAAQATGLDYQLNPGEGAFYGPKLEFVLRDAIGRDWQCGTLQADFVLPDRLNANYIGEDGNKHRPVMLHRAILGSLERFIAVLLEHYGGLLPLWLSPTQVAVATITNDADSYAHEVVKVLKKAGIRAITDLRNEKISYKIRELSLSKTPAIAVVGKAEMEKGTVTVRRLGSKEQEILALDEWIGKLKDEALPPSGQWL